MRIGRLFFGLLVVVVALWIIIGEQMSGASANAVVNARVVTVRADVAGDLRLMDHELGTRVSSGEKLAAIEDRLVDRVRLDDLRMEEAFADAEVAHARALLKETSAIRDMLTTRTELYRKERLADLTTRLDHARERLAILMAGAIPDETGDRVDQALDDAGNRSPLQPLIPDLTLNYARERVAVLEIAVRAARQHVFLGDGYNDAPNAEQRAVELDSDIAGLTAALARAEARKAAVSARLDQARANVNTFTGGEIASPVNGTYWEVLQDDGVNVQRGDPILRIVDCDSTMVTLSVTERVYNRLLVGQSARFRMQDDARVFGATVARLAGSGAQTIYRNLAVAPSQRHLERYDVMLSVPELNADAALGCAVGRTGRAFFEARPLDWLRGLFG